MDYGLPAVSAIGLTKRKVLPTFGVSFGLPYPSGAYPTNAFGQVPAQNQHFGAISPNGLDLGLINVNPLVSFQLSKTEYGEKVVKPLVNLHVTPNENIIHKFSKLFQKKPLIHEHYHHHDHYHPEIQYAPDYHDDHFAPVQIPPSGFGNHYQPHFQEFENNFHPEPFIPHFTSPSGFGDPLYPPSGLGYGYQRSSNATGNVKFEADGGNVQNRAAAPTDNDYHTVPTQAPGKSEGSTFVKFPNSRRRRSIEDSSDDDVKAREKVWLWLSLDESLLLLNVSFDSYFLLICFIPFSVNTMADLNLNLNHNLSNAVVMKFAVVVQSVHHNISKSESAGPETLMVSQVASRTQYTLMVMLSLVSIHGTPES